MASRMDRYRNDTERSVKNQEIYKQIGSTGSYSNIEGIADLNDSNEINISKIKEMLKNRENYQKEKRYRDLLVNEEKVEDLKKDIEEIEKKYDIKDVLTDALKKRSIIENDNHKFESSKYDILKELNKEPTEENIKETIAVLSTDSKEDGNLLDNLKGEDKQNTDIKQIIDEEKSKDDTKIDIVEDTQPMDKTFFTNSMTFTNSDFEEMHTDIKKNNFLLKIISILLFIAVIVVIIVNIIK